MAVQLFKDGGHTYVRPKSVQAHLAAGWSLTDGKPEPKHPDTIYPASLKIDHLSRDEAEQVVLGEMGFLKPLEPTPESEIPPPKKKGGWPKGQKRGPRKKAE